MATRQQVVNVEEMTQGIAQLNKAPHFNEPDFVRALGDVVEIALRIDLRDGVISPDEYQHQLALLHEADPVRTCPGSVH